MMKDGESWQADFPMREEVEDYAGKERVFAITCYETGLGFIVRAEEEGREGLGYEFSAYCETSPYSALGDLRDRMRRALATRHITRSSGHIQMLHDTLSGRITCDDAHRAILVVDGIPLGIDDLESILLSHEGRCFELRVIDRND